MPRRVSLILSALLLSGLVGCAAEGARDAPPDADADAAGAAVAEQVELGGGILDGVGTGEPAEVPFEIPDGARSASIRFACVADGGFMVEVFDPAADLAETSMTSGACDGVHELVIPIRPSTPAVLTVLAPAGAQWVASTSFSTAAPTNDPDLAAECDALSPITSAFTNADEGLGWAQAFGEDEWRARVDAARQELDAFSQASTTVLGPIAAAIAKDAVAAEPGAASDSAEPSSGLASAVCRDNRSEMYVNAEFGG